jgi:preprotein translocase subunit YajC
MGSNPVLQVVLWVAFFVILVLYIMRRRKRKMSE